MVVVHVTNFFIPEMGYQETYLARLQAAMGHTVHVITSHLRYPGNEYQVLRDVLGNREKAPGTYNDEVTGVAVHRLHTRFEQGLRVWLEGLERHLLECAADLVVVHGVTSFNALRVAALRSRGRISPGTRIVMDEHMLYSVLDRSGAAAVRYKLFYSCVSLALVPWFLRNGISFVAVTGETGDFMVQHYGIPRSAIRVIPIGVDVETFAFDPIARTRVRQTLRIAGSDIVLVHAGKLIREKGPHLIVAASIPVMKEHPQVRLLFIGSQDEEYTRRIKSDLDREGLAERVTWLPAVPHASLADYYAAADLGVWPTQESMTALEVSACGRPVILGPSTVSRERIAGGGGLSAANQVELTAHIRALVEDPALRSKMGEMGEAHMRRDFDWRVIAKSFLEVDGVVDSGIQGKAARSS